MPTVVPTRFSRCPRTAPEDAGHRRNRAHRRAGWRNGRHAQSWLASLEQYAFPRIGARLVSEVTSADVLEILTPIWHQKAPTARRVRQRLRQLLQALEVPAVPHGFRSTFRDWAAERTNHPREVIEAALAHVVVNQVEAAYARSDLFERRRLLMDDWFAWVCQSGPSRSGLT